MESGVALSGAQASSSCMFYCKWENHLVTTRGCCKNRIICFFLLSFLSFSLFCYTSIWFWAMCFLCDLYRLVVNHRPADVSVMLRKAWWWNPSVAFCCQLTRTTTMSTQRQVRRSNIKRALISWRWQELPRGKGSRRIAQKLRTNTGTLGAGRLTRLMK